MVESVIDTRQLFRPLAAELFAVLESLQPADWAAPTSAGDWRVRDVVAHLLDVDIRRISIQRDGHTVAPTGGAPESYRDLVTYLGALNGEWVAASGRISPRIMTELVHVIAPRLADVMEETALDADALFAVAWTGQTRSPMWLDVGREYTERWHHQDQIRDALGRDPLRGPEWLEPVIAISMLALPHAYRDVSAPPQTTVALEISGPAGGDWHLERRDHWQLNGGTVKTATCRIRMPDLAFARLLLHRLSPREARSTLTVEGRAELAAPLLHARAVMV